ncbi:hypothetical protein [Microbacterium sp. KCTC 39802]|uniref:hypothetical protein n=2 Tax=Microbacterium TaxID=33882 RepID=UPI000D64B6F4|nr:hypothetical protein [Microbacterium sp. KCTC 39802]
MIDPDDEQTVLSRRAMPARDADPGSGAGSAESSPAAGAASDPDPVADEPWDTETTQVRRLRRRGPALEATAPAARAEQPATALPPDLDATVLSARSGRAAEAELPTQAAESGPPGPRRAGSPQPVDDPHDDATILARGAQRSAPVADPRGDDGDRPAGVAPGAPAHAGRVAQSPGNADRVVYAARAVPTIPLVRSTPARQEPQPLVDTAATDATRRRRRRRRVIAVVAAASVALVVAVAVLVALLTTG